MVVALRWILISASLTPLSARTYRKAQPLPGVVLLALLLKSNLMQAITLVQIQQAHDCWKQLRATSWNTCFALMQFACGSPWGDGTTAPDLATSGSGMGVPTVTTIYGVLDGTFAQAAVPGSYQETVVLLMNF
jgi:hypothetical protein